LGRVKRDLYKNVEWLGISYDDIDTIMGLIVHRADLDKPIEDNCSMTPEYEYREFIRMVYIDLDNMIARTNLSPKQKYYIDRLAYGFDLSFLANEISATKREILGIVRSAAKRIQKSYHLDLINHLETSGKTKVDKDSKYKTCAKCGRLLNVRYFSPNPDGEDGFRNYCKSCRN
jgi:hypothetical protein